MSAAIAVLFLAAAAPPAAGKSVLGPAAAYELAVYWVGKTPPMPELKKLATDAAISVAPADMTKYAPPDAEMLQYFGRGLSAAQVAEVQKATSATRFLVVAPAERRFEVYQKVIATVAAAAKKWKGFAWDEATRELFTVEEWQKRRVDGWHDGKPDVHKHIVGHFYDDDPKGHRLVTLGMQKFALPDLSVDGAPATFGEQLLTLVNLTAAQLIAKPELTAAGEVGFEVPASEDLAAHRVTVKLQAAEPHDGDAPNALLTVVFPGKGQLATRMGEALKAAFGFTDEVKMASVGDAELNAARDRARARLPEVKKRFTAMKAALETLHVKAPFDHDGQREWMWVEVQAWKGDVVSGVLLNEPAFVPNLARGQKVSAKQGDLFDYIVNLRDGGTEGGETNRVLEKMQR